MAVPCTAPFTMSSLCGREDLVYGKCGSQTVLRVNIKNQSECLFDEYKIVSGYVSYLLLKSLMTDGPHLERVINLNFCLNQHIFLPFLVISINTTSSHHNQGDTLWGKSVPFFLLKYNVIIPGTSLLSRSCNP